MRKITAFAFTSLDGVIQAPGGPDEDRADGFPFGGWTVPFWGDDDGGFMEGLFAQPFDLLLGRRTYDIFAGYWPKAPADDPIGPLFTRVTKYVATSSPDTLDWANSVALTGDVPARIAELKQTDGPPLLTQGSSVLLHALLRHDLIDELKLLTYPVILGQGKRWFDSAAQPGGFRLESSESTSGGVLMNVYSRDGEVKTGEVPPPWE